MFTIKITTAIGQESGNKQILFLARLTWQKAAFDKKKHTFYFIFMAGRGSYHEIRHTLVYLYSSKLYGVLSNIKVMEKIYGITG